MNIESQGLKLKREVENFKDISKTTCAFANAYGGRIIIGISDNGTIVGVPPTEVDSLQQRLEGGDTTSITNSIP
jgi:predicted HTH transcriptional regulator